MAITYDLQEINKFPNVGADVIDANHSTYYLQDQGEARVKTQKLLVEKKYYKPSTLGTTLGRANRDEILIKEDNFRDVGGGYATFIRHYAKIPKPWFSFEEKSALVYEGGQMIGINYDSFYGEKNAFGNTGFNYKGATRRNINFLAKATRYYVTKTTMDFYQLARYSLQGDFVGQGTTESTFQVIQYLGVTIIIEIKGKGFEGSFLRPNMLGIGKGDNEFLIDATTKQDYPKRLYINAPLGTIQRGDNSECVIAPDRIRLWQAGIYEITRYTSSINLSSSDEERIAIQVYYKFDSDQNFTTDEISNLNVTLFADQQEEVENTTALNYYLFRELSTDAEKAAIYNINIRITDNIDDQVFFVKGSSINVIGGEIRNSTTIPDFDQGTIQVSWNGEKPKVVVNFDISKRSSDQPLAL